MEESTGIVEPCSKEKSLSPDVIELEDVSAQPSPSASDDVFGGAVGGGDGDGDAGEGRVEEGRVIVEPETGEQEAVLGGQSNTGGEQGHLPQQFNLLVYPHLKFYCSWLSCSHIPRPSFLGLIPKPSFQAQL